MLFVFAIYVLTTGKLQISAHYGVKGRGARIGGWFCLAIGIALQLLLGLAGMSFVDVSFVSLGAIFVVVPLTLVCLVKVYGNDFGGAHELAYLPPVANGPAAEGRNEATLRYATRREKRLRWSARVLLLFCLFIVCVVPVIVLVMGHGLADAGLSVIAAAFAVSAPALVGLLFWLRAQGLRRDVGVYQTTSISAAATADKPGRVVE